MRYVVASVGGLLIMAGAFAGIMMLVVSLYPDVFKTISGLVTMYIIVIPIAILAGLSSFRATLRHYGKQAFSAPEPARASVLSLDGRDDFAARRKSSDEHARPSTKAPVSEAIQEVKVNVQPKGDALHGP
jgi:hypothetical protein